MPSCATVATRFACSLVSFASVTTTPIVVFAPGNRFEARFHCVSGATQSWRSSSQIPPTLFATITAVTIARSARALAIPTPPGRTSPRPLSPPTAALRATRPGSRSDSSDLGCTCGRCTRGIARVAVRPGPWIAYEQVEYHRTHDGRDLNRTESEPHVALLEIAHDA